MKTLLITALVLAVACPLLPAQGTQTPSQSAQTPSEGAYLDAYVEMARSDVRTQKTAILAQAVPMTETESAVFWPVYRKYDLELSGLGDERLAIIKDYAAHYTAMTEAKAKELAERTLAWEEKRVELKKKYFGEFNKILPAAKAARVIQVETRLNLLIDLQIASSVPLMQ
jgi:hypothetical protein